MMLPLFKQIICNSISSFHLPNTSHIYASASNLHCCMCFDIMHGNVVSWPLIRLRLGYGTTHSHWCMMAHRDTCRQLVFYPKQKTHDGALHKRPLRCLGARSRRPFLSWASAGARRPGDRPRARAQTNKARKNSQARPTPGTSKRARPERSQGKKKPNRASSTKRRRHTHECCNGVMKSTGRLMAPCSMAIFNV